MDTKQAQNTDFAVVLSTCPNQEEALKITNALLSKKLAACVQHAPIQSFYHWQGKINQSHEIQLIVKCLTKNFDLIQKCICENSSYECPQVLQVPVVDGLSSYLEWVRAESV